MRYIANRTKVDECRLLMMYAIVIPTYKKNVTIRVVYGGSISPWSALDNPTLSSVTTDCAGPSGTITDIEPQSKKLLNGEILLMSVSSTVYISNY
jgi:hypothetical protein